MLSESKGLKAQAKKQGQMHRETFSLTVNTGDIIKVKAKGKENLICKKLQAQIADVSFCHPKGRVKVPVLWADYF